MNKKLNWNTVLLTVCMTLGGFAAKEMYTELKATHDAVLSMVPRSVYDVQMSELRTRLAAVEVDIQKMKDKHP